MSFLDMLLHKIMIFEKDPQKIGLSQFKPEEKQSASSKKGPSIMKKDVKLSDLMRRAG